MKRLLYKLLILSLPVILYVTAGEYLLFHYRETIPLRQIIALQIASPQESYYSRYFFDSSPALYKLEMDQHRKAGILALGRSTVLGFRSVMFHPFENSFYNMGFSVNTVEDIRALAHKLESGQLPKPKLMIIGFDATLIKRGPFDHINTIDHPHEDEVYDLKLHFLAYQLLLQQFYKKDTANVLPENTAGYGYLARFGKGYRKDGSMLEGPLIASNHFHRVYNDHNYYESLLKAKIYPLDAPYTVNPRLVADFVACLAELKKAGVTPVIFFPPVSGEFYTYFNRNAAFRSFFNQYLEYQDKFRVMHYEVIRFTTPQAMGLNDNYMQDAIHPGEVMISKIWLNFLRSGAQGRLSKNIDTTYLKQLLSAKKTLPLSFMLDSLVLKK